MTESLDVHLEFDPPGGRTLATDLGLARGTVVQAYAQLVAEGWLVSALGSGTRVAHVPHDPPGGRCSSAPRMLGLDTAGEDLVAFPTLPPQLRHLALRDISGRWGREDACGVSADGAHA